MRGSQVSAWPLHWQGPQLGKPHWPGWQSEHCRPVAPGLHWHWPEAGSHWRLAEPSEWQSQAEQEEAFQGFIQCFFYCWEHSVMSQFLLAEGHEQCGHFTTDLIFG